MKLYCHHHPTPHNEKSIYTKSSDGSTFFVTVFNPRTDLGQVDDPKNVEMRYHVDLMSRILGLNKMTCYLLWTDRNRYRKYDKDHEGGKKISS